MNCLIKLLSIYRRIFWSLERQARYAGVTIGENNFIASEFWSTEGYLIRVGNHCQITQGVKFLTHGGAGAVRKMYPEFDTFGRVAIGDYVYLGTNSLVMPGVTIGDNVLVAAGSVVINHHQHCYSGYEKYQSGMIFYGLGNFFFDKLSSKVNKE